MTRHFPNARCNDFQNQDVNLLSLSGIIDVGTPCSLTISLMYVIAHISILFVSFIGRKSADSVRRSIITQIVSYSLDVLGIFVMKSMVICFHFHLSIFECCSRPEGLWYYALTLVEVKNLFTYVAIYTFMLGHKYRLSKSRYILADLGWSKYLVL